MPVMDLDVARWVRRFEWHLDQLPGILEVLRNDSSSLKSSRYDSVRVSGSREQTPLPFKVDLVDAADDLWAAAIEYSTEVAERIGLSLTTAASWRTSSGAMGLSSRVTGYQARVVAFELIAWLIKHAEAIAGLPMNDAEDHLFGLIRRLREQYMLASVERPSRRRECTVCGERAVAAQWVTGDNGRAELLAECRRCGEGYDEPEARGA